jgi:CubicO group peptidase (beta-lactamase class C family)
MAAAASTPVVAQEDILSAEASDPRVMGWMQGTPVPPEAQITVAAGDFFDFPKSRWTVCHIRDLFPTVDVNRGLGPVIPLDYLAHHAFGDTREEIDALTFTPMGSDTEMTWSESLGVNYTDGMLIIHEGRVVYEWYSGCLTETGQHSAMSMTKSTVGILAEILIAEGRLDDTALASDYVPELIGTGFEGATVRQVMDMTTGIRFDENYDDPGADIWIYAAAGSPLPKPSTYEGPIGYLDYVTTVEPEGEHGPEFHYKTVNTDVLGWIVTRVTGMSYQESLSQLLWSHLGAEQSAYITVDALGTPFAGGGMSAGLRDLGRLGLALLNDGMLYDTRVFPAEVSRSIAMGGDRDAFQAAGFATLEGGSYRSMFWAFHNENGAYAARGVHGQTIYVDPTADMVIVRVASFPQPKNALIDPTSLPAYQAVADYLMTRN